MWHVAGGRWQVAGGRDQAGNAGRERGNGERKPLLQQQRRDRQESAESHEIRNSGHEDVRAESGILAETFEDDRDSGPGEVAAKRFASAASPTTNRSWGLQ